MGGHRSLYGYSPEDQLRDHCLPQMVQVLAVNDIRDTTGKKPGAGVGAFAGEAHSWHQVNFLWDKTSYVLGAARPAAMPTRNIEAFKALHQSARWLSSQDEGYAGLAGLPERAGRQVVSGPHRFPARCWDTNVVFQRVTSTFIYTSGRLHQALRARLLGKDEEAIRGLRPPAW